MIGETISHYRIVEKLGSGGMGVVYKAEDLKLRRTVALKLLPPELARDEEARKRLLVEAQAAASLDHPNICTVHEIDEADGRVFIAMSYVPGMSLRDRITSGPLGLDEALDIASQIARGLVEAHEKGVIHRDIKPGNVMLTEKGQARIMDFGLARLPGRSTTTKDGTTTGTLIYMSPEQTRGDRTDHRTDIWSFGVLLYEMLTGLHPFRGDYEQAVVYSIVNEQPAPLTGLRTGIPTELERIVNKSIAKREEERYQHASDLRVDIENLRKHLTEGTTPLLPSRPQEPHPSNLPLQLASFVGREDVMADIKQLLLVNRLVTLTGAGGCGKTRLAVEVARETLPDCPEGAWFVELGPLGRPTEVPQAVAKAMGLSEAPGQSLVETLAEHLRERKLMLLLDNCEHLLTACAELSASLLSACPSLRILATGREGLGITGEATYQVPSLAVPDETSRPAVDELNQIEAVRLFVDRARAVCADFRLSEQNASAVAKVCRRLDGIPLALELAAARVRALPVDEIAKRLDDRFRLLTVGSRTSLPRHRTLRALIDWSYDHLTDAEQTLLRRLSVYAGGWTLESAEVVCAGDGIDSHDVLDLLSRLVEKSLVMIVTAGARGASDTRYRMLETLREYGHDRMLEEGETATARLRHLDYFLALAESAEPNLRGPDQAEWLTRLAAEHDNLRVAIDTCVGSETDLNAAVRLVGALGRFWGYLGHWSEGRRASEELIARADAVGPSAELAKVLTLTGQLAYRQCDFARAKSLYDEGLALSRDLADLPGVAEALHSLGLLSAGHGDYAEAHAMYEQSLNILRELGDEWGVARSLNNLGMAAAEQGDYDGARSLYEESLAIFRGLRDPRGTAWALGNLGNLAGDREHIDRARELYEECLSIFRELGDPQIVARALSNLGVLARVQGDHAQARAFLEESLAVLDEVGDAQAAARARADLGVTAALAGETDRATTLLEESIAPLRKLEYTPDVAAWLEACAMLAGRRGERTEAAKLFGAAQALRDECGTPKFPAERHELDRELEAVRDALGSEEFARELAAGQVMSPQQAVDLALRSVRNKQTAREVRSPAGRA